MIILIANQNFWEPNLKILLNKTVKESLSVKLILFNKIFTDFHKINNLNATKNFIALFIDRI